MNVDIEPGLDAESAKVRACWDGSCRTVPATLRPTTTVIETACEGEDPSDVCSAEARRTGGAHGFAEITDLPREPVRITVTVSDDDGRLLANGTVRAEPEVTLPNGPECPEGDPQLDITVAADGTVHSR